MAINRYINRTGCIWVVRSLCGSYGPYVAHMLQLSFFFLFLVAELYAL